jgi:hypothetical protein
LNCNPPDLCLLSNWVYRCEPPMPGSKPDFDIVRNKDRRYLKLFQEFWLCCEGKK